MKTVRFAGRRIPMPGHPLLRMALGLMLIAGGFLGFLPVLGFWMLPLGLLVLSIDLPVVRRFRRWLTVTVILWLRERAPGLATRLGLGKPGADRF